MKYLVIGLGNVGASYEQTRHNVGFQILDYCAKELNFEFKEDRYAAIGNTSYRGRSITFIKPSTYMNLSGTAVLYWMNKLKIETRRMLVVVDDLSLEIGKLRLRSKGSHAGHNGLKNIEMSLGTDKYARLKVGIGNDFPKGHQVDFVLGEWTASEATVINEKLSRAMEMILSFAFRGITITMNDFNE